MNEQVRIAAPDPQAAGRLLAELVALEVALRESEAGWEVVVPLKSPNTDLVLASVIGIVEDWLAVQGLASTRMQVGDRPPTTVRPRRDAGGTQE